MPVDVMMETMTPDVFEWYLAFSTIEPFGAIHDERRAMTQAIMSGSYDKKSSIPSLEDMSPFLADCQDIGTDEESKFNAKRIKAENTARTFMMMPGWTKVESKE